MSTNKPAEFNFYLNTQGPRGRQGAQGPQGISPTITIGQNNANSFTLVITDANGTFETPNLKGNLIDVSDNGSYVRYQPSDGTLYTSDLEQATSSTLGGVRFATEDNLIDDISSGVVISPSDLQDYLAAKLTAGDNITITKDDETGIVTISAAGGGSGGVSSYNDLTDKPELFGTVIQNDNTLSHYVPLKAPLKESVGVDYERDIVIENGTLTDGFLTFVDDWHPMFSDTYSSFTLQGKFTLNGNEFTPNSYASMPINVGDIIGFPGGTGADIACGHTRESDGQFIFTHLLRVDGLTGAGEQSTENWCNLHVTNKSASGSTLQCSAENGTSTWLNGKNITNGVCYFQFRQDTDGSYIVVFIRQDSSGNNYGIKTVFSSNSAKADLAQLSRVFFGGTDILQNPQNQFFIYRNPGINLEDVNSESEFDNLTNMVNWQFPDAEHSLYVDYDNNTIKVNGKGQLYADIKVTDYTQLTNKPQINSVELTGNKTLDDLDIQRKFNAVNPLSFNLATQGDLVNTTFDEGTRTFKTSQKSIKVDSSGIVAALYTDKGKQSADTPDLIFPSSCTYFPFSQNIGFNSQSNYRGIMLGTRNPDGSFTPKFGIGDCLFASNMSALIFGCPYLRPNTISSAGDYANVGFDNSNRVSTDSTGAVVAKLIRSDVHNKNVYYRIAQIIKNETSKLYEFVFIGLFASNQASSVVGLYSKVVPLSEENSSIIDSCDTVCVLSETDGWDKHSFGKVVDLTNIDLRDYVNATPEEKYQFFRSLNVPTPAETVETNYLQVSTATTSQLGVVKPDGTSITVDSNGIISAEVPTATSDLTNDSGFITNTVDNLTNYTPTSGLAAVATSGSFEDLNHKPVIPSEYTLPTASTTTLGGVKVDGTTITVTSDGTITSVGGGTGGTTDYTTLTNKPQINSVELTGNKTLIDIGAQAITDNTLTTTNKTIVGAINELVTRIAALETQVTALNSVIDGQTGGANDA